MEAQFGGTLVWMFSAQYLWKTFVIKQPKWIATVQHRAHKEMKNAKFGWFQVSHFVKDILSPWSKDITFWCWTRRFNWTSIFISVTLSLTLWSAVWTGCLVSLRSKDKRYSTVTKEDSCLFKIFSRVVVVYSVRSFATFSWCQHERLLRYQWIGKMRHESKQVLICSA